MGTFTDKVGFENKYLEGTYVAVFVHLIVRATLLLFSEFIRRRHVLPSPSIRFETGVTSIVTNDIATADQMDNRYAKATNIARDSLLMLVIATIMTQSGYGATAASVIFSWIFVAISVCWAFSILFYDHMWFPLILEAIAFPFILAILALAFRPSEKGNPFLQYPPMAYQITSQLEWISSLTVGKPNKNMRKTSIICTIGPKTNSVEMITALREAGMNIVRMNFSHGSYEYHKSVIDNTRENARLHPGRPVAIALDTKGPEIRTGLMRDNVEVWIPISSGHEMIFSTDEKYAEACDSNVMYIDYKNLPKVIEVGKTIYVDDGVLSFEVLEVHEDYVKVRAVNSGKLCSKKGVNLPDTNVDLPAVSEKDKNDLLFGVENDVDMIFASFI
ncbi:9636_t:CDS:10, partial [Gigaspora rosea]